jgi:hypothetical protein
MQDLKKGNKKKTDELRHGEIVDKGVQDFTEKDLEACFRSLVEAERNGRVVTRTASCEKSLANLQALKESKGCKGEEGEVVDVAQMW